MEDHPAVSDAKMKIITEGFPRPSKPADDNLGWPKSVGDLTNEQLALHLTVWSGWAGYTRVLLAVASANQVAYESQKGIFRSQEMVKHAADYKTVTALRAAVDSSETIQRYDENFMQARVEKKILSSLLETYVERESVISREITRRRGDMEDARR